jgi:ATP-binding cassette subfamily F protein 3
LAFYAQHQLESLNIEATLLDELRQTAPEKGDTALRTTLGNFLFQQDEVFKKIKVLSGGERARMALIKVLLTPSNLLLLDEPTNHLDMSAIGVLTQTLQTYEGTLVMVTHDRHFLSQVANKIWYIEAGEVKC